MVTGMDVVKCFTAFWIGILFGIVLARGPLARPEPAMEFPHVGFQMPERYFEEIRWMHPPRKGMFIFVKEQNKIYVSTGTERGAWAEISLTEEQ